MEKHLELKTTSPGGVDMEGWQWGTYPHLGGQMGSLPSYTFDSIPYSYSGQGS